MNQRTRKAEEHKTQAAAEKAVQKKANAPTLQDNRPEAMAQRQLQESADKHQSTTTTPLQAKLVSAAPNMTQLRQNKEEKAIQKKNKTGMPDELKSGIEQLSGHSMDDVKVHYNSAQPKQLQAHAYAQGSNIHLGPGQEKHLPHEAWHVVQQKQGRVKPTLQMKSIAVNDDAGLEKEADNMGAKAVSLKAMEGPEADLATTSLSAGTVQRVKIILDPGTKKYREIKPSEQKAEGIIDTATIPALQREGIISHIKDNDKSSALLRKIQAETGSMAEAYSLEKLTELEPRISELEQKESAAKEAGLSEPDKKLLPPLAEELQKAAAAMGSIADQDFRQLFNAYYARFTQLKAVKADPKLKIVAKNHEDIAVDTTVDAATRRAYRDDTKTLGTWGGLSEAQQVALYFHKTVTIFRIDHEGTYRQVTTVGGGPAAQVGLLFLGNHYEAIRGAVDGNEATEGERRYETVPDGNCMYEAMWIACHNGLKPTPEQRLKYLKHVRAHVASHLTADVIDQNVQSAIVLGDQAGMGSKMREKLREKTNTAKWGHYTDGTLDKLKTDLKEGKESDLAQLDTAITAFKANRNQVDKDAKAAALDGLEVAIAKVRNGIHQKKWALSGGSITLNMDWWNTLQSASRANSENMKDFELARKLGIDYNQHAQEKVVPEADTKAGAAYHLHVQKLLAELDKLEELGKTLYGIEGGPVAAIFGESAEQQALAKLARAKLYEFATYSIRTTRAALIHSYHMQNKPEQRVGAGNRPDMHHAVYANNEPESGDQRKTPVPAGYEKEIQALVARSNKADKSGKAGKPGSKGGTGKTTQNPVKSTQEALSAIAAQRAYPHLFSGIELAKRREDYTKKDVEYYDNAGMPWDQKAGVSNPNGGEEADSIGGISTSIGKQMDDDHKFPQKDAPALKDPTQVPEGPQKDATVNKILETNDAQHEKYMKHVKVLLDTSYLTDYDYYRMWNAIIQHRTHEEIANIFEVKVNFDGVEKGGATKTADLTANQKLLEAAKSKPAVSADAPAKDKDTGKKKPGSVPKKGAPSKPASKAEESAPNFVMGGDGKPIYLIPKASIAGLSGELDLIKDPKTRGTKKGKDEIFRNHGHFLPNLGNSYFAEFNTNCLSEGASARIIWDETHDVFYITGTHYNPWMDKSGKLRNPFYKIVE